MDKDFDIPEDLPKVLRRKTRQGAAFVEHAPTLNVKGGKISHEAIGIRNRGEDIAALVQALRRLL